MVIVCTNRKCLATWYRFNRKPYHKRKMTQSFPVFIAIFHLTLLQRSQFQITHIAIEWKKKKRKKYSLEETTQKEDHFAPFQTQSYLYLPFWFDLIWFQTKNVLLYRIFIRLLCCFFHLKSNHSMNAPTFAVEMILKKICTHSHRKLSMQFGEIHEKLCRILRLLGCVYVVFIFYSWDERGRFD